MAHLSSVLEANQVALNGVLFPTEGPVTSALSSIYPQKQITGDITRDSQQHASVLAMSDWRGGIGLNRQRGPEVASRAWWSTCQLRYHEHLVLPPLATITAVSGVTGSFTIGATGELGSEIYAAFGTDVRKFNNTTDSWGSSLHTLPAVATHALTFRMVNVVYLAFATTGGYSYTSDGTTWVNDTRDAKYLAYWDDRLWGIDNTGLLWFSTAIGVETDEAQLPLPDGSVTGLFVGPLPDGELVLHAPTVYGLFSHDVENARFVKTRLVGAQHPDNGKGALSWRDSIYFPSGNGVFRYSFVGDETAISVMGPDRDDGLPSDKRGAIRQLVDSTNELLAVFDATTAPGSLNTFDTDGVLSAAEVISPDVGFSHIMGWDGEAWEVKWIGGSSAQAITYAYVSNAYSTYRLWWAHNARVYYMALPRDIVNPSEITTFAYAASAEHETAWFNADQLEVDKLALELRVETSGCTSTETVVVSYGLNYSTTYTTLGTIIANGITTYLFPDSTEPKGTVFRSIRFKVALARGSTTTLTPDVISLTLTYRKKLPAKYTHTFTLDGKIRDYMGRTPKERRAALVLAVENTQKVQFSFRDDSESPRHYWVDVVQATGLETTGLDERGPVTVTVVEP